MEIDEFVGMCGRRYRGCILECFRQGKVYPGVWLEMECRDGIDRRDMGRFRRVELVCVIGEFIVGMLCNMHRSEGKIGLIIGNYE